MTDDGIRMEALVAIGEMFLQTGDLTNARVRLEEVRVMAKGPEAPRGRAALLLGLADFFEADFQAARVHVAECLDIFKALGNQYAAAAALDVSGALAMSDSDPVRALRLCGAAAELRESSRGQLAPRWKEVLQGVVIEPASAAVGGQAATVWAEGRRMTFDQAVSYARRGLVPEPVAGAEEGSAAVPAAELTTRDMDVAELVADGMTDREIALFLGVSERTARAHVERIRGKLGVESRAQIGDAVRRWRGSG